MIKRDMLGLRDAHEEEIVDIILHTSTHHIYFSFKAEKYIVSDIPNPQYRREGKGLPVINLLNIEKEEAVRAIVSTIYDESLSFICNATVLPNEQL